MSENNKLTKTTIQVPAGLLHKVRIRAAETQISMSKVCRYALALWIQGSFQVQDSEDLADKGSRDDSDC